MAHVKDMTRGKPWKLMLMFALPLMVGNIFQQLYTIVDTAVVGQFVGVEALASLGAADWLNWLVMGIPVGFAQGFSILMSQNFGAGDGEALKKSVAMSVLLSIAIAVITLIASQTLLELILDLLGTPDNVRPGSLLYLRIYFSGIPICMAYNLLSGILRALGDSNTPLRAMIVAAVTNVALDLLFTVAFGWGIAGVAIATLIAQTVSMVYCLAVVMRIDNVKLRREHFTFDAPVSRELIRLGLPIAMQNTIISVGGLVVQRVVNGFGFRFIAGYTATNKLFGIMEMAAISYGYAISTFTGQNLGAGNYDRIKRGVRVGFAMSVGMALVIGAAMLVFGKNILMMFISGDAEEVAEVLSIAYRYLAIMACCLPVLYLLHLYRNALQGMGDSMTPMLSGVAELVMRVGCVLLLPGVIGPDGVYISEVAAWAGAVALMLVPYYKKERAFPVKALKEDAQ